MQRVLSEFSRSALCNIKLNKYIFLVFSSFPRHVTKCRHKTRWYCQESVQGRITKVNNLEESKNVATYLMKALSCEESEAQKIIEEVPKLNDVDVAVVRKNVKMLLDRQVTVESIAENPFMLTMSIEHIKGKLLILLAKNPRDINDFIPLLKLSTEQLRIVETKSREDFDHLKGKHRIYYFSEEFKVEPKTVAKYFSKHAFMLYTRLPLLQEKVDIFKKFNIEPEKVLKDLVCLRVSKDVITSRLEAVKASGREPMPWMVHCQDDILIRSLSRHEEIRIALDDKRNIFELYEKHVGWSKTKILEHAQHYPKLLGCSAKKIRDVVQFILEDTPFSKEDLSNNPWIFNKSLKTLKSRMSNMNELEVTPASINDLFFSENLYQEKLQRLLNKKKEKMSKSESSKEQNITLLKQISLIRIILKILPKCSTSDALKMCNELPEDTSETEIENNLSKLIGIKISVATIIEHPYLLLQETGDLRLKLALIRAMNPKAITDFIPLVNLPLPNLIKMKHLYEKEQDSVPEGHRIYYFSEMFKIEPAVVSKYFAKHFFLFEMKWSTLEPKLQIFFQYQIDGMFLLKDLWSLARSSQLIEERLKRVLATGIDTSKIKSWMIKCDEKILKKSMIIRVREKEELDLIQEHIDFLKDEVHMDLTSIMRIREKHPFIFYTKISKMRKILKLLLTNYNHHDIIKAPKILVQNYVTIKNRVEGLNAFHLAPPLYILNYSHERYEKYLEKAIKLHDKHKEMSSISSS